MAPDARIVSLKVGTADGGVDVSQVIAAIDWVVQHRHDHGLNIRVLNLSYGTNSTQTYDVDPLAVRGRAGLEEGHRRRRGRGQQRLPGRRRRTGARRPRLQPVRDRRRRLRLDGHARRSPTTRSAPTRRAPRCGPVQAARLRRARLAPPGPARPELVHRRGPTRGRARRPLLPRQRHERGRRDHLRRGRARPPEVPEDDPRPGQELLHRTTPSTCTARARSRRDAGEIDLGAMLTGHAAVEVHAAVPRSATGTGSLEARARPGSPDPRRRRPHRRAGHLRQAVRLGRDGEARGARATAGRAARGTAAPGRAAPGPATRWSGHPWSGNSWSGSSWSAAPGPATAGAATAGRGNTWSGSSWSGSTLERQQLVGLSWSSATWLGASWGEVSPPSGRAVAASR